MDLIDLAQDRWQDFMNMVMNFRYHKMQGVLGLAEELLTSQEGPSSVDVTTRKTVQTTETVT